MSLRRVKRIRVVYSNMRETREYFIADVVPKLISKIARKISNSKDLIIFFKNDKKFSTATTKKEEVVCERDWERKKEPEKHNLWHDTLTYKSLIFVKHRRARFHTTATKSRYENSPLTHSLPEGFLRCIETLSRDYHFIPVITIHLCTAIHSPSFASVYVY